MAPRLLFMTAAAVATLVLAVVAVFALRSQGQVIDEIDNVVDARRMLRQITIDITEAESAQRGYLLTGDEQYINHLNEWDIESSLGQLRVVRQVDSEAITQLSTLLYQKQAEMQKSVLLFKEGQAAKAIALVKSDVGRSLMVQIRAVLEVMFERERTQTDQLVAQGTNRAAFARPLVIAGAGFTILALFSGLYALLRGTRLVTEAADRDAQRAADLAQKGEDLRVSYLAKDAASLLLAITNEELARSNRDLDQFAYVASHDLKAPLRAISSLSTWIEEEIGADASDDLKEYLRLLRSRVFRMESLIEGILNYSRADSTAETARLDTRACVADIVQTLKIPSNVEVRVLPGEWPTFITSRVQFSQVWNNLISNALKYGIGTNGGVIELGSATGSKAGEHVFWVKDDGPGISAEYHDQVFALFKRLQSRDEIEGAGIGLSIVRKLVTRHGGTVTVESTPGNGAKFSFTWKVKAEDIAK